MEPVIQMNNICKTFKVLNRKTGIKGAVQNLFSRDYKEIKAVDDISLTINAGEMVGYLGPNGAGKSSLLNCINGIYKPQEGKILFKGEVLDKITPNIIAQKGISRTFQNLALFKRMSVLDNILVGRKLHSKANFFEVALQLSFCSFLSVRCLIIQNWIHNYRRIDCQELPFQIHSGMCNTQNVEMLD